MTVLAAPAPAPHTRQNRYNAGGASGPLPPHIMGAFKKALEDEYLNRYGPCVGDFMDQYGHQLSHREMEWCDQQEERCRRNPRHCYNL